MSLNINRGPKPWILLDDLNLSMCWTECFSSFYDDWAPLEELERASNKWCHTKNSLTRRNLHSTIYLPGVDPIERESYLNVYLCGVYMGFSGKILARIKFITYTRMPHLKCLFPSSFSCQKVPKNCHCVSFDFKYRVRSKLCRFKSSLQ